MSGERGRVTVIRTYGGVLRREPLSLPHAYQGPMTECGGPVKAYYIWFHEWTMTGDTLGAERTVYFLCEHHFTSRRREIEARTSSLRGMQGTYVLTPTPGILVEPGTTCGAAGLVTEQSTVPQDELGSLFAKDGLYSLRREKRQKD